MSLRWDLHTLCGQMADGLASVDRQLRLEQAVYGVDSWDESTIQTYLTRQLKQYYEVSREVRYPSSSGRKLSHRQRCDLVLSPKGKPLWTDVMEPNLFDPPGKCSLGEGLWLEVKVAYQFRELSVRHHGYGGQWRNAIIEDIRKMEAEAVIREAGLVLVVFNESKEIIEKDLEMFEILLAQKEVLAGFRQVQSVPIQDRIGHQLCTVAVWPTLQR